MGLLVLGRRQLRVRASEDRTRWRENPQQDVDGENLCPWVLGGKKKASVTLSQCRACLEGAFSHVWGSAPVSAASALPQASALSPAGATIAVEVGSRRLSRW